MSPNSSQEKIPTSSFPDEDLVCFLVTDPKELAGARAVSDTVRAVQGAFLIGKAKYGLKQADVARRLEVDRSIVNRRIIGRENMSVKVLGELAWAMGQRLKISFEEDEDQIASEGQNSISSPASQQPAIGANWHSAGPLAAGAANTDPVALRGTAQQRAAAPSSSQGALNGAF